MPPRYRTSIVLAVGLVALYLVFWRDVLTLNYSGHAVDVLTGELGGVGSKEGNPQDTQEGAEVVDLPPDAVPRPPHTFTEETPSKSMTVHENEETPTSTASANVEGNAGEPEVAGEGQSLQEQFEQESEALGQKESAGAIYGTSLDHLIEVGGNAGFAAAALVPTNILKPYSDKPPYTYYPYPEYNTKAWKGANEGIYHPCNGPFGAMEDIGVFSGHPSVMGDPLMGSYVALDIDSNLCFERETRLGAYILSKEKPTNAINWGALQRECADFNSDRFIPSNSTEKPIAEEIPREVSESSSTANVTGIGKTRRLDTIEDEAEAKKQGLHGMPTFTAKSKPRTAVLIRTTTGQKFSENDKQNIRSLITELSLKSGGEYQVFLLMHVKDRELPIFTDATAYDFVLSTYVPDEFQNMTVLYNDAIMKEKYPLIPSNANNDEKAHWLAVQMFSQDYPEYELFWNWEFETRYTGHHYDLLEKLSAFGYAQPRRGIWERSERFYISKVHGPYNSKFRKTVEKESGQATIWGPALSSGIIPMGPTRPFIVPEEDKRWEWGVEEHADFISLAPMFNPVNTSWPERNDVWGYDGSHTPRRASVGTHSRCSKTLLRAMHEENLKGNHLGSEMGPQTVALLHGLKAVYAPIPMFFDREWRSDSLQKYFNPGPEGQSGNVEDSPFSRDFQSRFDGTTWYSKTIPPMRLYNNWLGMEDNSVGGNEWEKEHGRICLPPMLLRPIESQTEAKITTAVPSE